MPLVLSFEGEKSPGLRMEQAVPGDTRKLRPAWGPGSQVQTPFTGIPLFQHPSASTTEVHTCEPLPAPQSWFHPGRMG